MTPTRLDEFDRQPHAVARGRSAEAAAVAFLEERGYRVVERNHLNDAGEIDLIADEGGTRCFVEVKAVRDLRYGPAVARVDARKQRRVARAAALYLAETGWEGPCRFDVLGLEPEAGEWRYELVRDAFDAPASW
ncbi:MAG: YraN family protein [Thermoanaerobaculia bacterium]|nr:YraN family protein [Thermoanaerobaculia bacterium]